MRKISAQLISAKPVSLSRAAKLISRFAAVENGSSPAVSLYLQRSADAFNHLVQFHKQSKRSDSGEKPDREEVKKSKTDSLGKNPDGANPEDSKILRESDGNTVRVAAEANPNSDLVGNSGNGEKELRKEKKKKKKRKSDSLDAREENPNGDEVKDLGSGENEQKKKKKEKRKSDSVDAQEENPNGDELKDLGSGENEQKKKKKKKKKKERKSEGASLDS